MRQGADQDNGLVTVKAAAPWIYAHFLYPAQLLASTGFKNIIWHG